MWQKSREAQRSHKLVSFCSLLIPYTAELCQVPTASTAAENEKFWVLWTCYRSVENCLAQMSR